MLWIQECSSTAGMADCICSYRKSELYVHFTCIPTITDIFLLLLKCRHQQAFIKHDSAWIFLITTSMTVKWTSSTAFTSDVHQTSLSWYFLTLDTNYTWPHLNFVKETKSCSSCAKLSAETLKTSHIDTVHTLISSFRSIHTNRN